MKAAILRAPGRFQIEDIPKPDLKSPSDVLLKMKAVGICGSDLHYLRQGKIGDQIIDYPWIAGHECAAEVEAVGSRVTKVKVGDPIVIDPNIPCGHCSQCKNDREHTCLNGRFLGCPGQLQGCMTEYLVMPESCCFLVDNQLDFSMAVLIEPMSIGLYATGMSREKISDAAILGAGPIGLCTLLALKENQTKSLFLTDKINARLRFARKLGVSWIGNPEETDVVKSVLNINPDGLDAVFECCGDQEALDQSIDLLKPGGTLFIIGIPETRQIAFDISKLRRKEIAIRNVRRQNNCIPRAIQWIRENRFGIHQLITHRFPLDKAQKAFELVSGYSDNVIKAVIEINKE